MTDIEAQQLIVVMSTAWPDGIRHLSADQQVETQRMYVRFLLDLPYDVANAALTRMIAATHEARAWPTIATLRREISTLLHGRQMPSGEAWGVVLKLGAPRDGAAWGKVDPLIRRCCEAMGWIVRDTVWRGKAEIARIRVELGDHEPSDRARFCELYDQLAREQRVERATGKAQIEAPRQRQLGATSARDAVQRVLPKTRR